MAHVRGIDWDGLADELKGFTGKLELGFNSSGVVQNTLHFTGDEVVSEESMPGVYVDQIIASVAALSAQQKAKRPGGYLKGQIPITLWRAWRMEWEKGPKLHGVLWRAFFNSKFMDRDFSKFRVDQT